ncbi:MAG: tripartite tricarboxylate transporter substrate binding protein [Candidatus Parcubacteria bacterium]|nr:tripartite tricarboxylate transporter substrate binding protein [Burkholderiales bacterium]
MKIRTLTAVALFAAGSAFQAALAAPFPEKPVRIIVPFAPGGNVDIVNRIVAQAMGDELKQSFIVENRAGANGAIGTEYVARSAPDGYTLVVAVTETMALNPSLRKTLPYEPLKDFTSIGIVDTFPFSLVLSAKVPANDVKSFVAYARERPGKLNFSSWGNGSLSQIAMEQLKQLTGIDLLHVPFKGAAPAITAVTAGTIEAFIAPLSLSVPYSADGRVKLIAVTSAERQPNVPNVPTLTEQGIPVVVTGWHVLAAPAGTPADVIATLNRALLVATARADVRDKLLKAGVLPAGSTPQEAQALVNAEFKRWGDVARKAGIAPE